MKKTNIEKFEYQKNKAPVKQIAIDTIVHVILAVLAIIWLFPLVWLILNSFRGNPGGSGHFIGNYIPTLFPEEWTLANYKSLFTPDRTAVINFPRLFFNTLLISVFSCIISTTFVVAVSYVMSRRRFKARQGIIRFSMILGLFPGFMAIVAIYQILKASGLLEGNFIYLALILMYSAGSGTGFLLLKGYMDSIPYDLDEAATIDGATQWQIFTRIIIPVAKPMIVYQVLTSFLGPWLDFIGARVIAGANANYWTVSVGLFNMLQQENINRWYGSFLAGAVLVTIPIGGLTIYMQRFYNQSLAGAVKG